MIKTSAKDGSKTITVRLQGVDAPELHYKAAPLKRTNDVSDTERANFNAINKERRQCFGESATVALAAHLKPFADNKGLITATFDSLVDHPFEVVDTYGRFIGDIHIGQGLDINVWLVENGWAVPTFYTSMTANEIQTFLTAWKKGKTKSGRTSKSILKDAGVFDWNMLYLKPPVQGSFHIGDDKGLALMPKIFRRQVSWMVQKKAKVIPTGMSFHSYLKKAPDQLVLLNDFLANGITSATIVNLHDFISADNKVLKNPEEMVFNEKPGTLVNAKGKKVTEWFG